VASGDQFTQYAVEAAPNGESGANAVSTTVFYRPLQNFTLNPSIVYDDRTDEFRGTAQPITPDVTGKNATDGSASGRLYANQIVLEFLMMLGYVTPVVGNGVLTDPDGGTPPAATYRYVWDSATINPATIRSAQITRSWGNNTGLFVRDRGVTVTGLDIAVGDQNAPSTFTANYSGLYQTDIADPSLTPAYDATTILPFYRAHFSVPTWLSGSSTPINASFSFTNPVEPAPGFSTSQWPVAWQRPDAVGSVPRLTGTLDLSSVDIQDYQAFLAGTPFTYKCKWISTQNIGATSYKYSMWIEGAASYSGYDTGAMEHNLRNAASVPFTAGASGGTSAYKVTIVNGTASPSSVS
jgi:hypothetical protein